MSKRIRSGPLPHGTIPSARDPRDQKVVFSFLFLDLIGDDFDVQRCEDKPGYISSLMGRLRDVSRMTVLEFQTNRGSALRSHRIFWDQGESHSAFEKLPSGNQQLIDAARESAYQFSVTANEHGRVHGFFLDTTFHVVWLDPDHRLYPKK